VAQKNYPPDGAVTADGLRPRNLVPFIDPRHQAFSITKQAELLGVDRQAYYYQPVVNETAQARLKAELNAVDAIYTKYPFYGQRRILIELERSYGIHIGRERIRRLMAQLGLQAIYPKPNTSKVTPGHAVYPYLLKGVVARYPNHIWGTDITYIRTAEGFVYLVAFIDWYSRYVVAWELHDSLHNEFVLSALRDALCFIDDCGLSLPDICNSDQGSHFTAQAYLQTLEQAGIQISMDGRGRYLDNIFTERLWRSVKYEDVFLNSYPDLETARAGLARYFHFYNYERPHQAIDNHTPAEVYFGVTNRP
jgi:putative transposase